MAREYTRLYSIFGDSPVQGEVLFHDRFEHILHWEISGDGADYFGELSPNYAFLGNQSLHLKTRTVGTAPEDHCTTLHKSFLSPSRRVQASFVFFYPDTASIHDLEFAINYGTIDDMHSCVVLYDDSASSWLLENSDGAMVAIPDSAFTIKADCWHRLTLRIDFLTNFYHSLQVDEFFYDLSAQALDPHPALTWNQLSYWIRALTDSAAPSQVFIDDFILSTF